MNWIVFGIFELEPVALADSHQLVLVESSRPLRKNAQLEFACVHCTAGLDFFLQVNNRPNQLLRSRRAARHIYVHRHKPIDPLYHGVCIENTTRTSTSTHRDAPLRLRHLQPNPLQHRQHLHHNATRDNHQIALPRRKTHDFATESRKVVLASSRTHQFNTTASCRKGHGPKTVCTSPRGGSVQLGQEYIVTELLVYLRRQSNTPLR